MTHSKWLYIGIQMVLLSVFFITIEGSGGDQSLTFQRCLSLCRQRNCSKEAVFLSRQPKHMQLLQWGCEDECKYKCMWSTVEIAHKVGNPVPQFYGKWPFVRFMGIQEPASMLFSVLNAVSHLSIFYYRARVPSSVDMYYIWHGMSAVSITAWLCATVFHTRDTAFTEKLDYFSAFALVLYHLYTLICKLIGPRNSSVKRLSAAVPLVALYSYHISCLLNHFDYGYNMKVNIGAGAVNGFGWIAWSWYHRRTKKYVWKCVLTLIGLNALLMLELGDFPPILWTIDAHALWHAGTICFNFLWYSFIIDESLASMDEMDLFTKKSN